MGVPITGQNLTNPNKALRVASIMECTCSLVDFKIKLLILRAKKILVYFSTEIASTAPA